VTSIGATGLLSAAHLKSLTEGVKSGGLARRLHVHVSGYFSCPSLQQGLAQYLQELRARAAERGQQITISFDTNCDASGQWGSGVVDVLREVDVFLPNEVEAAAIANRMGDAGEDANTELAAAADRLASTVRQAVIITCGKEGCIFQTRDAMAAGQQPRRIAAPSGIQPVDATGAGDAFDAGFIFRWAVCGGTMEEAVCAGSCCGALCTESVGANANPPSAETLSKMEASQRATML